MACASFSRRCFLSTTATICAGTALAGSAKVPSIQYIDIHTHLGAFYPDKELTAEGLIQFMDEHGVERSVVLPLISPEAAPVPQTTQTAIQAYRKHPERIIPFCAVDPRCSTTNSRRYGHVAGVRGIVDILRRYQDEGCRGLGEHKTGLYFDAPHNMYLYEACAKLDLPILFHLDDIRNTDTPGLPRLENVLRHFPTLPLIGHAAGFWASISGDATFADFGRYPKIPTITAPGGTLDRLMTRYPNLYGDLSEPGGEKAIARDLAFGRAFILRHADQLLFGTDVLMPNQKIPQFELLKSLNLPIEVQQKIYRDNALRILKLT
jgi:predicted TIM-barrel fold metal-dependent hydrolase|tara:strand:- start:971 stop:1933 length:963 start_codon:yes stop_codon:yes gene_type:complete